MRIRRTALLSAAALAATLALASPALAHDGHPLPPPGVAYTDGRIYDSPMPDMPPPPGMHPDMRPEWREHGDQAHWQERGGWEAQRGEWLDECHRRYGSSDNGIGGAVIGGVVGGLLGNRIAGRGNRTAGTIIGAGVGAVAGTVIDRSEDRGRSRDYCESYLDQYMASYGRGGYGYGSGYGYGPQLAYGYAVPMMMVPMVQTQAQQPCTETVVTTEEWVTVPGPHRYIPRRPVVHDKRVRIVPDKRIRN
ncbi:MAG TPA: glycine zipper 2TM domain-containing protein [Novosphingobium sp.]|nr:glycine zipper 2TM domain-containing protein [Novosphingobium sp.]